jgi:hypothetical protein
LKVSYKTVVPCSFIYASLDEAVKSYMGTGPAAAAIKNSSKDVVEHTIATAMKTFRLADDIHFMQNQFLVFIATK